MKEEIKKEGEWQQTLNPDSNNNTTNCGHLNLQQKMTLEAFYMDYSETGMSLVELKRKFLGSIHENTIARYLAEFKAKEWIALCARNVGPTKRRKYYKITEKGALIYESINRR